MFFDDSGIIKTASVTFKDQSDCLLVDNLEFNHRITE
jgi:hypothetical protein